MNGSSDSPSTDSLLHDALVELQSRRVSGGIAGRLGEPQPRGDAIAWAILAFRSARAAEPGSTERSQLTQQLRAELKAFQLPDGRVTVAPEHASAYWPTTLAILSWLPSTKHQGDVERALDFLISRSGGLAMPNTPFVGHDSTLVGWSWIQATHSWVEPTAMALLTLSLAGQPQHPRCAEARKLLLNRQLTNGGWNYGNTEAFGQTMRPAPDSTGIALTGLAGQIEEAAVAQSLGYLEEIYQRLRSPLSVAWAVLGLAAWGRRPADAQAKVEAVWKRQDRLGPFDSSLVALLSLALSATKGLGGAIR